MIRRVSMFFLIMLILIGGLTLSTAMAQENKVDFYLFGQATQIERWLPQLIDDFEAAHPGVRVKTAMYKFDLFDPAFKSAWASGTTDIDVIYLNGQFARDYFKAGVLKPLGELIPERLSEISSGSVALATDEITGKVMEAFIEFSTIAWFYNKSMFAEGGWDIPKTWDDVSDLSNKVRALGFDPMIYPESEIWFNPMLVMYMFPYRTNNKPWEATIKTMKGEIRYDDPIWVNTIKDVLEWEQFMMPGWTAMTKDTAHAVFTQGSVAMYPFGSWTIEAIQEKNPDFDFGVFENPINQVSPGLKSQVAFLSGMGWTISERTQKLDLAIDFLNLALSNKHVQIYCEGTGRLPSKPSLADMVKDSRKKFFVTNVVPTTGGPCMDWLWEQDVTRAFQKEISAGFTQDKSAEAICASIQKTHEQVVEEGKNRYPQTSK